MTSYPDAPREDLVETIHGRQVADPYRWLEDRDSDETKAWLAAQEELYARYLETLPGREKLTERLGELLGPARSVRRPGEASGSSSPAVRQARSTPCCTRSRPPALNAP